MRTVRVTGHPFPPFLARPPPECGRAETAQELHMRLTRRVYSGDILSVNGKRGAGIAQKMAILSPVDGFTDPV